MISRRTLGWLAAFLLLGCGTGLRLHWEKAHCIEYMQQHMHVTSGSSTANDPNTVVFPAELLCQPGELEPWWAKCIILGAFGAFIGAVVGLVGDVWAWLHRVKI